jgi:hypothetical protein
MNSSVPYFVLACEKTSVMLSHVQTILDPETKRNYFVYQKALVQYSISRHLFYSKYTNTVDYGVYFGFC